MNITIKINCENAAFGEGADAGIELSRILKQFAEQFEHLGELELMELDGYPIRDINGNQVGRLGVMA